MRVKKNPKKQSGAALNPIPKYTIQVVVKAISIYKGASIIILEA